jgi:arsenate reductase (thioredoxin)
MARQPYNVLFLCTGNTARSIIAEVMLNAIGKGKFRAYSAGSHPKGAVNPYTIELLQTNHLPTAGLRSKDWAEFAQPGAPALDFVFTVCDNAAGEVCPVWPGQPMTAHWGIPDPAAVGGADADKRRAFGKAYNELRHRLSIFANLPIGQLDRLTLQRRLDEIGEEREGVLPKSVNPTPCTSGIAGTPPSHRSGNQGSCRGRSPGTG